MMLNVSRRINMEQFINIQPVLLMVLAVVVGSALVLHYFPGRPFAGSAYVAVGIGIIMAIGGMLMPRWQGYLSKKLLPAPLYKLNRKRGK